MRCELFLKPLQFFCEGFVCHPCYGLRICDMKKKKDGGDVVIIITQNINQGWSGCGLGICVAYLRIKTIGELACKRR